MKAALLFVTALAALGGCDDIYGLDRGHQGPVAFIQKGASSHAFLPTAQASVQLDTPSGPDALLVLVATHDAGLEVDGITDNLSNTYIRGIEPTRWATSPFDTELYYTSGVNGAAPIIVTVTLSGLNASICDLYLDEYAGADPISPLDQTSVSVGIATGTQVSSGAKTTTETAELIFGHGEATGATVSIGEGFFRRQQDNGNIEEDRNVVVRGSYEATFNLSSPAEWIALMATFR